MGSCSEEEEEFSHCYVLKEGDDNLCEPYRKNFFYEDLTHCISPCFTNTLRFCERAFQKLSNSIEGQTCQKKREVPSACGSSDVGRIVEVVDECLSCQKFEVPLEDLSESIVEPPEPNAVKSQCVELCEASCSKLMAIGEKDRERCKNININVKVKIQKKKRRKHDDKCDKEKTKCRCKQRVENDTDEKSNITFVPCREASRSKKECFAPQLEKCRCKQRKKSVDSTIGSSSKLPAILEQNVFEDTRPEVASVKSDTEKTPRKDRSRIRQNSTAKLSQSAKSIKSNSSQLDSKREIVANFSMEQRRSSLREDKNRTSRSTNRLESVVENPNMEKRKSSMTEDKNSTSRSTNRLESVVENPNMEQRKSSMTEDKNSTSRSTNRLESVSENPNMEQRKSSMTEDKNSTSRSTNRLESVSENPNMKQRRKSSLVEENKDIIKERSSYHIKPSTENYSTDRRKSSVKEEERNSIKQQSSNKIGSTLASLDQRKSPAREEDKKSSPSMVPLLINDDVGFNESVNMSNFDRIVQYSLIEHSLCYTRFVLSHNHKLYSVRKINVKSKFVYTETKTKVFGSRGAKFSNVATGRVEDEIVLPKSGCLVKSEAPCEQLYDLREIFKKFEDYKQEQFLVRHSRSIKYRRTKRSNEFVFAKLVWKMPDMVMMKIIAVHLIFFIYFVVFVWVTFFY